MEKFIEWTEEFSVDIQEIDAQHKILLDLTNQLHELVIKRANKMKICDMSNQLANYGIVHFTVEESLMRLFGYPEYERHKQKHEEIRQQLFESLHIRINAGSDPIGQDLLGLFKQWLIHHITTEDKQYATFLLETGLRKKWVKQSWGTKIWNFVYYK